MVLVAVISNIHDLVDANPNVDIQASSNQDSNGTGDGNTNQDWEIVQVGNTWQVWLRAERSGRNDDRVYDVSVTITDMYGNSATDSITATVPHSQGGRN